MRPLLNLPAAEKWKMANALFKPRLREGDLLTHTVCMGSMQEHYFVRWDGNWIVGRPTRLTALLTGTRTQVDDIAASNITHVNRDAADAFLDDDFADLAAKSRAAIARIRRK